MNLQPDFSIISDNLSRSMVQSAWTILTPENIEFLKNYIPHQGTGFIWDSNPTIEKMKERIDETYPGHSGASLAFTLRMLQRLIHISYI